MGVHELRGQASLRGLSTSGTKKVLLEGIAADIERDSAEENRNGEQLKEQVEEKADDIERIRAMGLCDLREQATLRGLLANGTKKALLARIAADIERDSAEGIAKAEEVNGSITEKLVTVTKKGNAVLDQWLPDHVKSSYHVLQHEDEIYDAVLNQTNLGPNNNKFYVIQILGSCFWHLSPFT
ncbi:Poly [ADP-ribose] polymerase 2 [Acorus gramineus]|uniref:NAD(+) ADP-ribosyltransferase n=1 Tax=Acorus gramineus TaxID=55184 RepID=A0AAV9BPT1_ACOGR|nr:Poly [ADP-ribose] polymerase 2 [Acorus gramineus]